MTDERFYRTTFLWKMADSSDEDDAAAVFVTLHLIRKQRKKRKIWVRPWIMQRYGFFVTFGHISLLDAV